jgi:5-methyltetrahydrofolate--homocysteine methyltransferase
MVPAMDEVGRRFEANEYFVPELLISARAMKAALELVRPLLVARGDKPLGKVAIGTVKGDLHDIGKNLVASLLEGGGFEVIDLGSKCGAREVHRGHPGEAGQHCGYVRIAHYDDAFHEGNH